MSIQVEKLTKRYGLQDAVHNVSFTVNEGEILGFLGPNGAGKSTTLKIIAGFLPPTEGTVTVSGKNVIEDPMFVKSITGYLPEHNPLYHDMYVHEYLDFVTRIYGIKPATGKLRVLEMIKLCGLKAEQNKKIGMLSKGYRQRVGLAQALIHEPQVLVLDEPTSGLDPNQLVEIRKLIKTISKDRTVLFSSHILQEVEALCDRVVVINKGEIVADDRLENLLRKGNDSLIVEFASEVTSATLMQLQGVEWVQHIQRFQFHVQGSAGADIRPALTRFASENNLQLIELKLVENSLESVFSQLTNVPDKPA